MTRLDIEQITGRISISGWIVPIRFAEMDVPLAA
jgi:hypothetical protein